MIEKKIINFKIECGSCGCIKISQGILFIYTNSFIRFISDIVHKNVKNISFWRQERFLCSVLIDDTEKGVFMLFRMCGKEMKKKKYRVYNSREL